jgi:hypothetical protein
MVCENSISKDHTGSIDNSGLGSSVSYEYRNSYAQKDL